MRKSTIYINDAKFTADIDTIDAVMNALEAQGFVYDEASGGWQSSDFCAENPEQVADKAFR